MKINIVCVGTLKEKYFKDAVAEYLKRLTPFAQVRITEVKEEQVDSINREAKNILPAVKGYLSVMAIDGKQISSEELAAFFKEKSVQGVSEYTFVIGGSYGTGKEVRDRADQLLSFGRITLPHQLFRVVLLEQIYRAFSINNNSPYHK